jgi:hypothetical protein
MGFLGLCHVMFGLRLVGGERRGEEKGGMGNRRAGWLVGWWLNVYSMESRHAYRQGSK